MTKKIRNKVTEKTAVQFTGTNIFEVSCFVGPGCHLSQNGEFCIMTLEGDMRAKPGDWIIKGLKNECYPCKPDIFEQSYEIIEG